jgi:hypothetical protein
VAVFAALGADPDTPALQFMHPAANHGAALSFTGEPATCPTTRASQIATAQEIVALNLRRISKPGSALLGIVTLWWPQRRQRVHEVLWGRRSAGAEWVRLPDRRWEAADGFIRYAHLITFDDTKTEEAFQRDALAAIHALVERTGA